MNLRKHVNTILLDIKLLFSLAITFDMLPIIPIQEHINEKREGGGLGKLSNDHSQTLIHAVINLFPIHMQ